MLSRATPALRVPAGATRYGTRGGAQPQEGKALDREAGAPGPAKRWLPVPALAPGQRVFFSTAPRTAEQLFSGRALSSQLMGRCGLYMRAGQTTFAKQAVALRDQPILNGLEEIDHSSRSAAGKRHKTGPGGDRRDAEASQVESKWARAGEACLGQNVRL